jgi:hypothetical protein
LTIAGLTDAPLEQQPLAGSVLVFACIGRGIEEARFSPGGQSP